MPTEMTGIIFLLSRIFDGISDIIMGIVVDKVRFKHGKTRLWILWLAIPFGFSAVLMMLVPQNWNRTAQEFIFLQNLHSREVFTHESPSAWPL